jgi:anti-sigma B factor antagonist
VEAKAPFTVQQVKDYTVVEFKINSLMDAIELDHIAQSLYRLVDEEDRRRIILDFEKVQYLSSQAIGIIMAMRKKLGALSNSKLILVGVGERLMQLIKIVGLDKALTIKATQKEAINVWE